jgi:hypothetical protein
LLPSLLRIIADELERDQALAERIVRSLDDGSSKKRVRNGKSDIGFDPFEVLRRGAVAGLRERLEALEIPALKAIITQHGLDTTRLAQKWRDKERLVNFILERISPRAEKGDVFKTA